MKITVENICVICEKKGCVEPCEMWYDCLQGKPIDLGIIEEGENEDEKN